MSKETIVAMSKDEHYAAHRLLAAKLKADGFEPIVLDAEGEEYKQISKEFGVEYATKLYAFWKYDLPPYLLGGEVEEIRPDGITKIKGYTGLFKPVKIVPLEKGIKLHKKLKKAYAKYAKTVEEANNIMKSVAKEISE